MNNITQFIALFSTIFHLNIPIVSSKITLAVIEPVIIESPQIIDKDFETLMFYESGNEFGRINKHSLACGIGQAEPCTKLYSYATKEWIRQNKIIKTIGKEERWYIPNPDYESELEFFHQYIATRYKTSSNALNFWKNNNWY